MTDINLSRIASEKIDNMISSGVIENIIAEKVEQTIKSKLDNVFDSHSDFGRQLEKRIKEGMNIDLSNLHIECYHDKIIRVLQKVVDEKLKSEVSQKYVAIMANIIKDPPKEIHLSELISAFKESNNEWANEEEVNEFTVIVEDRNDNYFLYLYFDKKCDVDKHRCDNKIGLHKKDGNWEVFTMTIDEEDMREGKLFTGPYYDFERLLYQLWCAKSKVILDIECDEIDNTYDFEEAY